ncbi:N6-adenosine-methyltransferase TMT1A-like [Balaenoptera acutorostrata]|uniref:N6-adenosine-methyltransferase TMT1A-like n=1 Tax=Balaenoptera acutorostrata TaxID=9767 RepID=A0ABM3UGQ7_BALAC|nr:N6-adenosine-methyltransferase TMT1A-like [Balaenoptera acutorostrata]
MHITCPPTAHLASPAPLDPAVNKQAAQVPQRCLVSLNLSRHRRPAALKAGTGWSSLERVFHYPRWWRHPPPCSHSSIPRPHGSLSCTLPLAVLTHPLFLSVCILAFPMYLLDFLGLWNRICKKSLPYFLARFTVMYNEQMASKKQELFSNLQEFAGPSGKLSLLELGCSTGPNFKFYPPGCRVACIDPNPNFEKFLIKSIAENRHLQFERFLVAAGEDLHQVADDSMDVVVCTLVLCSVKNQERILQDVCRVRRPVNALNFLEHTAAKHSSWNFSTSVPQDSGPDGGTVTAYCLDAPSDRDKGL